jgi:hypothetical protein
MELDKRMKDVETIVVDLLKVLEQVILNQELIARNQLKLGLKEVEHEVGDVRVRRMFQ